MQQQEGKEIIDATRTLKLSTLLSTGKEDRQLTLDYKLFIGEICKDMKLYKFALIRLYQVSRNAKVKHRNVEKQHANVN